MQPSPDEVDTPFEREGETLIAGCPENLRELLSGSTMLTDSTMGGEGVMLAGLPPSHFSSLWSAEGDTMTDFSWHSSDIGTLQAAAASSSSRATGARDSVRAAPAGAPPGGDSPSEGEAAQQPHDQRCGRLCHLPFIAVVLLCNLPHAWQGRVVPRCVYDYCYISTSFVTSTPKNWLHL